MKTKLSPPLSDLIAANNAHDTPAFLACFSGDAVVRDEGHQHNGLPAIKAWFVEVSRKYQSKFEVTGVSVLQGETILDGNVSGNFEGSPFPLRYFVTVQNEKITALKIAP